jgi:hypothetical protein
MVLDAKIVKEAELDRLLILRELVQEVFFPESTANNWMFNLDYLFRREMRREILRMVTREGVKLRKVLKILVKMEVANRRNEPCARQALEALLRKIVWIRIQSYS